MSVQIKKRYVSIVAAAGVAAAVLGGTALSSGEEQAAPAPAWFKSIAASYDNDPRLTQSFDFASLYAADYPEWFAGIAAYYDNDPRLTPEFDFASLYSGVPAP